MDVAIGSRFTCEDLYWTVIEKISDGVFQLQCETPGTIGNNNTGSLIPVDYIQDLATATLTDLLIPGADEESDEELRTRYFSSSNNNAFGGNIEDYKEKIGMLDRSRSCKGNSSMEWRGNSQNHFIGFGL